MNNMHAPGSSVDITKQSFWAQRLQTADTSATTAVLFDKASPIEKVSSIDNTMPPPAPFARTTPSTGINPSELRVAAIMHYLSPDTLILAAWAILCRSYAGEDGPVSFGACLDREGAAWLFAMPVSGDDRLLGAMRAAEQDKKLVLDHALAFDSLAAFSQSTGYVDLATAVYICSGAPKTPDMHLPVRTCPKLQITTLSGFSDRKNSPLPPSSSTSARAPPSRRTCTTAAMP